MDPYSTEARTIYDLFRNAFPYATLWADLTEIGASFWHYDLRDPKGAARKLTLRAGVDNLLRLEWTSQDHLAGIVLTEWMRPFRGPTDVFLWVNQLRQEDHYPEELDRQFDSDQSYGPRFPLAARLANKWAWHRDASLPHTATTFNQANVWFASPTRMCVRNELTEESYFLTFKRLGDPLATRGDWASLSGGNPNRAEILLIEGICARFLNAKAFVPPPDEDDAPLW